MSDGTNWLELQESASLDVATVKQALDLVAVCEHLGIVLEEGQDGKWHGNCPFHDDHRPSFDVFFKDNGDQACGCFACDFGTPHDVFDLLMALRSYGFGQALREAQQLVYATKGMTPRMPRVERKVVDHVPFVEGALKRVVDDQVALQTFLRDRSLLMPSQWLIDEFRLGVTPDGAGVVIPHYDQGGTLLGAKVRRTSENGDRPWRPVALGGTKLNALYGIWRDTGAKRVVLVEGESDTWTVAWLTRDQGVDVFGLPSGAAARPKGEWTTYLQDRDVTLLFDADDAGRTALRNWVPRLGTCSVAQLDEGQDASSEKPERVLRTVQEAVDVKSAPGYGLVEAVWGGYYRYGDENQTMVCDFTLHLLRTIEVDGGGLVFDVLMQPRKRVERITSHDLENDGRLRRWANARGGAFYGAIKDAQELLRILQLNSLYCARLRGTSVAGWHDGCFVFPEPAGVIGGRGRAYVPSATGEFLLDKLDLAPCTTTWDPAVLTALAHLHRPDVLTPLLGWIAAAPLRPLVPAFPIFALVGGAGWGKTTLVREVLQTFGYKLNLTLTSTTPYAVTAMVAATNSIPAWFDEYRVGARDDVRARFEQTLRDAWEASMSYRGGLGDQKSELRTTPVLAPIIVTGEDAFRETSHLERMAIAGLPREGKNPKALEALRGLNRRGFGRTYLEWLVDRWRAGALPEPPDVPDRPAHARAVTAWGYALLEQFAHEVLSQELPTYDDALLVKSHAETTPVLYEVLQTCEGRSSPGSGPILWRSGDDVCFHLVDVVREARVHDIRLPGNARAVQAELEAVFGDRLQHGRDTFGRYLRIVGAVQEILGD